MMETTWSECQRFFLDGGLLVLIVGARPHFTLLRRQGAAVEVQSMTDDGEGIDELRRSQMNVFDEDQMGFLGSEAREDTADLPEHAHTIVTTIHEG